MTSGRKVSCLIPCLVLAGLVLFFSWPFVLNINIQLSPANNTVDSQCLAKDTLRAARDIVQVAMQSLFGAHENELQLTFKRNAMIRGLGAEFERLQTSLDDFHRRISPVGDESPDPTQPTKVRHVLVDICESVGGKRITMIGGEHIYRLHVFLLRHRERAEGKPFPCQYHEFCTHHHICFPRHASRADSSPRYIKPPTAQELIDTDSAAINYIVSDTLFSARNESSLEYMSPFVDPMTGVRLRETYWLGAARKANIVILGRGPLSAPGETYIGNWSFLHHVPDRLVTASAGGYRTRDDVHINQTVLRSLYIFNAAVHLTVSRFLPDVFQLLLSIAREVRPTKQKRLIWPSSWYRLPGRGVARTALLGALAHSKVQGMSRYSSVHHHRPPFTEHALMLQLSALLDSDITKTNLLEDPWTLLFNAQVYLQNFVLRELLPRYGVTFLPLDALWVEGDPVHGRGFALDVKFEAAAVGEAFLTSLDHSLRYLE